MYSIYSMNGLSRGIPTLLKNFCLDRPFRAVFACGGEKAGGVLTNAFEIRENYDILAYLKIVMCQGGGRAVETVSGINNWRLTVRRETAGVTILRAVTCDAAAALPDTLLGLPVTALGDHALAPGARPVEGEEVLMTCGPQGSGAEWDNHRLRELTFPAPLERVGDYALLNCDGLRTLHLHDGVRYWSGGALMNCRLLERIYLTRIGEAQGETLAYLNDELSRELDVTILQTDGQTCRLLFPEFIESYEENCPAHHFDYNIYGGGYPYHHCFRQKKLDLRTYDGLWQAYLGMEHEPDTALRLAWWRLRYPVELSEAAEGRYWAYLRSRGADAAAWLLTQRDAGGLRFLLEHAGLDREALAAASALAREQGAAEALAILLEEQHRRFPAGADRCFAL